MQNKQPEGSQAAPGRRDARSPSARKLLRMCGYKEKVREETLGRYRSEGCDEFTAARAAILERAGLAGDDALRLAADKAALYSMMDRALRHKRHGEADAAFARYIRSYADSGSRSPPASGNGQEARVLGVRPAPRPHESLVFPADVIVAIIIENLHPDDVRRVLVYGLKLHSNKRSVGAKYFNSCKFDDNAERSLEDNGREIPERVRQVRDFLVQNGVISYYKHGDTIRLNMQKEFQRGVLTRLGGQILDSIKAWLHEFQEATAA